MKNLCFIDIETTGAIFGHHEIIEVAAIRTSPDGKTVIDVLGRRLQPVYPERITSIAQKLTGFHEAEWMSASKSNYAFWSEFANFCQGCVPVCHNPSFDRAFISLASWSVGIEDLGLDYHWIGTESLGWPLYLRGKLPKLSLSSLCEYLNIDVEPLPHTARGGAEACRNVYLGLMEQVSYSQTS